MRNKTRALVTGASSGIGEAFAAELAARRHDLVLVARRADRLDDLASRLNGQHEVSVETLVADLAVPDQLRSVEERLEKGDIGMLVNNAGRGDISLFADQDRSVHEAMIKLNVIALTRLAHAAIPAMVAAGEGVVINVGSGFAFDFMPGASVYAATKAYVVQLTNVLDAELVEKGIRMQALIPGLTRTELGGASDSGFFDQFPPDMIMEPAELVKASLAGLDLGELVCIPALPDIGDYDCASSAMREVGRSREKNVTAPRYRLTGADA